MDITMSGNTSFQDFACLSMMICFHRNRKKQQLFTDVIYIYVCMYVKYILQIKNTIIIFFLV